MQEGKEEKKKTQRNKTQTSVEHTLLEIYKNHYVLEKISPDIGSGRQVTKYEHNGMNSLAFSHRTFHYNATVYLMAGRFCLAGLFITSLRDVGAAGL